MKTETEIRRRRNELLDIVSMPGGKVPGESVMCTHIELLSWVLGDGGQVAQESFEIAAKELDKFVRACASAQAGIRQR
jgi:hypothetical protein